MFWLHTGEGTSKTSKPCTSWKCACFIYSCDWGLFQWSSILKTRNEPPLHNPTVVSGIRQPFLRSPIRFRCHATSWDKCKHTHWFQKPSGNVMTSSGEHFSFLCRHATFLQNGRLSSVPAQILVSTWRLVKRGSRVISACPGRGGRKQKNKLEQTSNYSAIWCRNICSQFRELVLIISSISSIKCHFWFILANFRFGILWSIIRNHAAVQ